MGVFGLVLFLVLEIKPQVIYPAACGFLNEVYIALEFGMIQILSVPDIFMKLNDTFSKIIRLLFFLAYIKSVLPACAGE